MSPDSYRRCAKVMVLLTEKNNFRAASCCKVDVVKGAVGLFLAGLVSFEETLKLAALFFSKNASTASESSNVVLRFALIGFLSFVKNSA